MTGDFGGNLATWDLEEECPVEEVAGAHSQMINCVAGTEGGRVVTGGRDGEVYCENENRNTCQKKRKKSDPSNLTNLTLGVLGLGFGHDWDF